jgi:hypothetical protein
MYLFNKPYILVPFLPGNFVDTDVHWCWHRGELFTGKLFQYAAISPLDDLIVEAEKPPGFFVGGDGSQTRDLLGETACKSAT